MMQLRVPQLMAWITVCLLAGNFNVQASQPSRHLQGRVFWIENDKMVTAKGIQVVLKSLGRSDTTNSDGMFFIPLLDDLLPGEPVTLIISKPGLEILQSEKTVLIPRAPSKTTVDVQIALKQYTLPPNLSKETPGSRKNQSDSRSTQTGRAFLDNQWNYGGASALAASPDGRLLAATRREIVTIWDVSTGRIVETLLPPPHDDFRFKLLRFSQDGSLLAAMDYKNIVLWDTESWSLKYRLDVSSNLQTLALLPKTNRLVTGDQIGTTKLWKFGNDAANWESIGGHYLLSQQDSWPVVSLTASEQFLAIGYLDVVKLWSIEREEVVRTIERVGIHERVSSLDFSPDGSLLVIGSEGNEIEVRNIHDEELRVQKIFIRTGRGEPEVMFSPDGRFVAASDLDAFFLWEVASGKRIARFGRINSFVFIPHRNALAIGFGKGIRYFRITRDGLRQLVTSR